MHLFLTSVLPFLAHDHASAAAFLTCRHHNFHGSIIPEFLSDEERVQKFCEARQQNQLKADKANQYTNLYNLFVQTPLMQFSPSLVLNHECCCGQLIIKPLLAMKYFCRTLQRCAVESDDLSNDLLQALSKAQSLTEFDSGVCAVKNQHLETIINSFPSLVTLAINDAELLDPTTAFGISSPPPAATKTIRNLTLGNVGGLFATQFVPHFKNLRKLELSSALDAPHGLNLRPLLSSPPLLTDLSLAYFTLENTESLKNLHHLSSLQLKWCQMEEGSLSLLPQEHDLPHLTQLLISNCDVMGLSPFSFSFASLAHAPNLQVLEVVYENFNNDDCFQYLDDMVHLRKLRLTNPKIIGDSRLLKKLIQNSIQLEELNLEHCRGIGNQGAIAGALYSTHIRLRVLNLSDCNLVDDDLNGIGKLKNTLEALDLSNNCKLTNEGLMHCRDLVKLKRLNLSGCQSVDDLSPLKDCLNVQELNVSCCCELTDDTFKIFSEEPNSFPNLRFLSLACCFKLTEKVFEHLWKNNHLVYQLKELHASETDEMLRSLASLRNNICQLKGLQRLLVCASQLAQYELMRRLRNLEEIP